MKSERGADDRFLSSAISLGRQATKNDGLSYDLIESSEPRRNSDTWRIVDSLDTLNRMKFSNFRMAPSVHITVS